MNATDFRWRHGGRHSWLACLVAIMLNAGCLSASAPSNPAMTAGPTSTPSGTATPTAASTPAPSAAGVRVEIVWGAEAGLVRFEGPASVSREFPTEPSPFAYSEAPGWEGRFDFADTCELADQAATIELPVGSYAVTVSAYGLDFEFPMELTALTPPSTEYRVCRFDTGDAFRIWAMIVHGRPGALAVQEWWWPGCFDVCPGNLLFFSREGDIYVINPDMDDLYLDDPGEVRLTEDPAVDHAPAPINGAFLASAPVAYISERDGQPEIYVMNRDGSDERRLTRDSGVEGCVVSSPEGDRLAFVSVINGRREIHLIDADGSKQRRLTEIEVVATGCPVWSPDGRQLAFVGREDAGLFVIGTDGSGLRRLTSAGEHVVDPGQPTWVEADVWSASRIAFGSATADGTQLVVVDADGSNRASLGDSPPWVCPAANGPVIAFIAPGRGDWLATPAASAAAFDLALDGEGLARRVVARNAVAGSCPDWSADGYNFAYEGAEGIYVIGAHGGNPRLVAPGGHEPRWSSTW
jgi:TolB protein